MDAVPVCLYSKYSQRCKEFLDDISIDMGIQMLCIDNKDVRKTIMADENGYHIKTVPCLFLFFSNGRLEKYEGSDAFAWLRKFKESVVQPVPPPPVSKIQQPVSTIQQPVSNIEDTDDQTEQIQITQTEQTEQTATEQILEKELSLRRASDQIITRKQDNIKELAQMMQRQRESDEERMNPPPPNISSRM